jgi:hypothetical protein
LVTVDLGRTEYSLIAAFSRRKSLTELLGENVGGEVWDRFTVHYTPTHGSWLNQEKGNFSASWTWSSVR